MKILNSFQSSFKYGIIGLFAVVFTIFSFNACDSIVGTDSGSGNAKLNVFLTDAPAQYDAVFVDIQKIRIHHGPAESDSAEADSADGEGNEGEWITLSEPDMKLDLLKLQNGADTLLAAANLEPGHYSNLRLVLGSDNEVIVNGKSERLKVPSGQQSGFKLKLQADIEAGKEYKLVVDFDANESVHKAGKSGKYILRPVLRTVSLNEVGSKPETGSISGVVQPAAAQPQVFTVMNSDTISTMADTTNGDFKLTGLQAGSYDVNIEPTDTTYQDTVVSDVTVQAGQETSIDTVNVQSN